MANVRMVIGPEGLGSIVVDGQDWSQSVSRVEFASDARSHGPAEVIVYVVAPHLEVEAEADVTEAAAAT